MSKRKFIEQMNKALGEVKAGNIKTIVIGFDSLGSRGSTPILDTSKMLIVFIAGAYRFVDYKACIITAGFGSKEALLRNASGFLATPEALKLCQKRYEATVKV